MERALEPSIVAAKTRDANWSLGAAFVVMVVVFVVGPFVVYPVFLMKALCFALFACAFNLLIGYGGLASFGHALFFGWASYVTAYSAKVWSWPPELALVYQMAHVSRKVLGAKSTCRCRGFHECHELFDLT